MIFRHSCVAMMHQRYKKRLALLVAEFFYCGRFPYMPGTIGSLGALVIWVPSVYCAWPWWLKVLLIIALFILGLWASIYGIEHYKKIDPKQVVIDEVVGIGFPFLVINPNILEVILAFLLFRFFDILKPWPIKYVEQRFPDHWGIMLDDVVAGIFAMLVLCIVQVWL